MLLTAGMLLYINIDILQIMHVTSDQNQMTFKIFIFPQDLLTMNEELKKARKAFDEIKYVQEAT